MVSALVFHILPLSPLPPSCLTYPPSGMSDKAGRFGKGRLAKMALLKKNLLSEQTLKLLVVVLNK